MRRNRRRFWKAASGDDKQAAYLTLYECLETREPLDGAVRAVHHRVGLSATSCAPSHAAGAPAACTWRAGPREAPARLDAALLAETAVVQRVVGLGRAARNASRLKVRQPLVAAARARAGRGRGRAAVRRHEDQILEELNVKKLELIARDATLVSYRIKPNLPVIGKRYGKLIPAIRGYLAKADGAAIAAAVARGETQNFVIDGAELDDRARTTCSSRARRPRGSRAPKRAATSSASTRRSTTTLRREGLARELVRAVQDARKQAGLEVSDRIALHVEGDDAVAAALRRASRLRDERDAREPVGACRRRTRSSSRQEQGDARWTIRLARDRRRDERATLVRLQRRSVELALARRSW